MAIKVNISGVEVSIDEDFIRYLSEKAKSLARKIAERKERKEIEKFLRYREFLVSNRKQAALLVSSYYKNKGLKILDKYVPILYKDGWIPESPINLQKVILDPNFSHKKFDFDNSHYAQQNILPFGIKRYTSLIDILKNRGILEKLVLYNNPAYRLIGIETQGNCVLKFGLDTYFNYIDTCELIAFESCRIIVEILESQKQEQLPDIISEKFKSSLRSQIDPFDFSNRSAGVGINTILIVLDNEQPPKFYLHERSAVEVAEAINTIHVVPAGTFQPRHKFDAYHSQDYNLYTNLIRELAEELLGMEEFRNLSAKLTDIFKIEILKKINFFVKKGLIKVYYLGIGLDCLTLKPEILTALVCEREIIDIFLWNEFTDCFEGKNIEIEFSKKQLETFIKDERTLPAGAACLWLVKENFEFFRNAFR